MLTYELDPRFSEADPLGHINNTVVPVWLEHARTPLFKIFNPDLAVDKWNLIIKKIEVDFIAQIFYGKHIEISTALEHIGNTSFIVVQEVRQDDKLVARGRAVLIHFDYQNQKTVPIPDVIHEKLRAYLLPSPS